MGSEDYPYKGVLDLLANRCLASGTNAWTDVDHTCYTMTTAGHEGFLNLLPIYIDHVLYPTLTEPAYYTEVHHVNGDGEDAGIVYCEMQARENTGESKAHLAMLRAIYPGECGYKSETGGIMENLRTSTSHKKVCGCHRAFYRPENLCLIVTGQVEVKDLFSALADFEAKIESKGDRGPYTRPWQSTIPPLSRMQEQTIQFPSDDEEHGLVLVAWRGPQAKELHLVSAMMVLLEYLTDTAVAPLQQEFVETSDPYCSKVKYSILENQETCIYLEFENTPHDKLDSVTTSLTRYLKKIVDKSCPLNMDRMNSVIHRRLLDSLNHLEENPHDTMAFICIGDFLYGNDAEDLNHRLNQTENFKKMKLETEEFWLKLISKYLVEANHVAIIGEPSTELMETMADEEKERVAEQRRRLGKAGLKKLHTNLMEATTENEVAPPEETISSVPIPSTSSIKFHPLVASSNCTPELTSKIPSFPLTDMPFKFLVDDMHTHFVKLSMLMNTSCVPQSLKPYLCILMELLLESPIQRNAGLVPYEDVVAELASDTLTTVLTLGVDGSRFHCGPFAQVAVLMLKVEVDKYRKGIQWAGELLFRTVLTAERVRIIATKMMSDVSRCKRNGQRVVLAAIKDVNYSKESNHYISGMMRQQRFLTLMLEELKTNPSEVIARLEELRKLITAPESLTVHVVADVTQLAAACGPPAQPWKDEFLPDGDRQKEPVHESKPVTFCSEVKPCSSYLLPYSGGPAAGVIIGVGAIESAFLVQTVPCLCSYTDADLPAIEVFIQYLTQLEGPMWRQIRGHGLSYHYSMSITPDTGLMTFVLFKSTHIASAYKRAKTIVDDYVSGRVAWDATQLESSKSSLIFEIIEQEKTVTETSTVSLLSHYRDVGTDYNKTFLEKVSRVTVEDLARVGLEHIAPLFDTTRSKCVICVNPTRVPEVQKAFKRFNRDLTILKTIEEGFLCEM
ncbi:PREDICTED: uncharacterized protein C05D11.1-like isoform X2 [Priapulus caudatus]|uniref:Uncharacterized protein C05D11.1-like isoform X2 n=1 Tax=Priapulus caudatus TaxID=37621 RepID=A0ABM1EWH3_PRICU|nr:PREDICTED: uncharacterized protein C05D11.1-like isoform X2 [Priapulus caudatus]